MREWVVSGILVGNIILQSSVFPYIQVYNTKPDSLLVLVVAFSLLGGNPTGAVIGFFGGLLQDILFGGGLGLYALQYMVVGYLTGLAYGKIYIDRLILPVVFVIIACFLRQFIMFVYCFFMQVDLNLYYVVFRVILPEIIYTALLMPLGFFFIRRLYRYKFMRRKWRFD